MLAKLRKGNYWTLFEKRYYISSNFSMFKINIYHCVVTDYGKVHDKYMLNTLIQDLLVKILNVFHHIFRETFV